MNMSVAIVYAVTVTGLRSASLGKSYAWLKLRSGSAAAWSVCYASTSSVHGGSASCRNGVRARIQDGEIKLASLARL